MNQQSSPEQRTTEDKTFHPFQEVSLISIIVSICTLQFRSYAFKEM